MTLFRRLLSVLLLCLFGHLAQAAEQKSILIFGDSLSTGYGMSLDRSWPSLMQQRIREKNYPIRVINASRKGETTDEGMKRLQSVLDKHRPSWVLLELGANDGLRMASIDTLRNNLAAMLDMIRGSGATPILVGMKLPPTVEKRYARDFEAAFSDVARQTNTAFVPFLLENIARRPDQFIFDRLHPTAEAQPELLEVVWPVVNPMLTRP